MCGYLVSAVHIKQGQLTGFARFLRALRGIERLRIDAEQAAARIAHFIKAAGGNQSLEHALVEPMRAVDKVLKIAERTVLFPILHNIPHHGFRDVANGRQTEPDGVVFDIE